MRKIRFKPLLLATIVIVSLMLGGYFLHDGWSGMLLSSLGAVVFGLFFEEAT